MLSKTALLSFALPVSAGVLESLSALPYGWTESSTQVSNNAAVQLQVALNYQNLDQLESELAKVSTPGSSSYGKYYDVDDINSKFGPSDESTDKVTSWLEDSGAEILATDGAVITFQTTIGHANQLLDTQFKVYTDGKTDRLRTTSYSVPDGLEDHIDMISPTTYFGSMRAHSAIPRVRNSNAINQVLQKRDLQTSCLQGPITIQISANETRNYTVLGPECTKQLYNIGDYQADPNSGSTIAFGSFLNQSASYSDLALYEKIQGIPSQSFKVLALINGGVDNQDPLTEMDGEANLDVQNIIGLVDGLPVGEYITGGLPPFVPNLLQPNASTNQNEPYLEYYQYLLSQPNSNLPYVITNSYGDIENTVPEKYAKRVCCMIGMMGLRGRTILESSGDQGVGAVCLSTTNPATLQFAPEFPGTCPYLTAVGGTQLYNPEQAWNKSTGGFSMYFKQPWYQKKAVGTYLSDYISAETKSYYSSYTDFGGRGVPDVSAHSQYPDYFTVVNGTAAPEGGTSAAAPVVAAIFALLNDARLRAGKPAIGFVNPALYAYGSAGLNDITLGTVLGCNGINLQSGQEIPGAGIIPYATWNATVGWDPATGLGTPNFQELVKVFLSCAEM